MAQYPKEKIKEAILKAAKNEFIQSGFRNASIRQIAENAAVKPGNIYNYFKNKEELFQLVLNPLLKDIESGFQHLELKFQSLPEIYQNVKRHHDLIYSMTDFIEKKRNLISLLIYGSAGSPYENYCDNYIKKYSELWLKFCCINDDTKIDPFVLHNISGIFYNFLREIIMHDITGFKLKKSACDLMSFIYGGFHFLINQARSADCSKCAKPNITPQCNYKQ